MKKVKVEYTFATAQFENAKPTVEISIPDNLDAIQEYWYLYDMFHEISQKRPSHHQNEKTYPNNRYGLLQARKDGVDVDNSAYLDGDEDEGARIENNQRYNRA